MTDLQCPYCEYGIELDHDDGAYFSEDKMEECECPNCEKNFMVRTSISFFHKAEKCDCLNGSDHDWQPIRGYPEEVFVGKGRCSMCDEERMLDPEAHKKAMESYMKKIS